jgi:phosphate starvation-inducible PhoH-like protein
MSRRRQTERGKSPTSGFKPTRLVAQSNNQKGYIKAIKDAHIVFVHGPAGSGKTHVAAASAVRMLRSHEIERICICRPVVGVGRDIGFLPGTMEDKVGPYLIPLFDEFCAYMERAKLRELLGEGIIEITPLSMMRGRTFRNSFVILDEAQNATMPELRMMLTRIGSGTKMVLAGDLKQSDLPLSQQGAFKLAVQALSGIQGIEIVQLECGDIVRHPLIEAIENNLPKAIGEV